jgi:hypothetical protein
MCTAAADVKYAWMVLRQMGIVKIEAELVKEVLVLRQEDEKGMLERCEGRGSWGCCARMRTPDNKRLSLKQWKKILLA